MKINKFNTKNIISIACLLIATLLLLDCGKKNNNKVDSRSLEQIYEEQGVPVRVIEINNATLSNEMVFMATMSGVQETNILSRIQDNIVSLPVKVGQHVSEGQLVAKFPTNYNQIQWEQAKTALDNAKKNYDRMSVLLKAGDIAQANFDGVETQYLVAKQNFESLNQMVNIEAPFTGIITNIAVKVGDKVNAGAVLMTIAKTSSMIAKIWATEQEVTKLRKGMTASISIAEKEYKGKIDAIALSMDQQRRAFQVDVLFNNSKNDIKSGMTCDLIFKLEDNKKESIIIPRRVIKTNFVRFMKRIWIRRLRSRFF